MTRKKLQLGIFLLFLVIASLVGIAQDVLYRGPTHDHPRWARLEDFDGSFVWCRGFYDSDIRYTSGVGWWTDYPGAEYNFLVRFSALTAVHIEFGEDKTPRFVVVRLNDPLLRRCSLLFFSDPSGMILQREEALALRDYLDRGGFVWADDFWGTEPWLRWVREMSNVLPEAEWEPVPRGHMLYTELYQIEDIWQMPHIGFWYANAHETSEAGEDSITPTFHMLRHRGRIVAVVTHNTDIADGWEEETHMNVLYREEFSGRAYGLGINIFLYALTH